MRNDDQGTRIEIDEDERKAVEGQPETQGAEPLVAALGPDGNGDLAAEDLNDPTAPDGQFQDQGMRTEDGEMTDGGAATS